MIIVPGDTGAAYRAVGWLANQLDITTDKIIDVEFSQHFNCRVVRQSICEAHIEFDDEPSATAFLLRWS